MLNSERKIGYKSRRSCPVSQGTGICGKRGRSVTKTGEDQVSGFMAILLAWLQTIDGGDIVVI